jgi:hypothetical protein
MFLISPYFSSISYTFLCHPMPLMYCKWNLRWHRGISSCISFIFFILCVCNGTTGAEVVATTGSRHAFVEQHGQRWHCSHQVTGYSNIMIEGSLLNIYLYNFIYIYIYIHITVEYLSCLKTCLHVVITCYNLYYIYPVMFFQLMYLYMKYIIVLPVIWDLIWNPCELAGLLGWATGHNVK